MRKQYSYYAIGRLLKVERSGRTGQDFMEEYEYDAGGNGNRTMKRTDLFAPPGTTSPTETRYNYFQGTLHDDNKYIYTYGDLRGNITAKRTLDNAMKYTYEYDIYNRIVKVKTFRPGGATTPVSETTYIYNQGLRTEKIVDGVITRYAYENLNLVAEFNAAGEMLAEYQYEPDSGLDQPVSMIRDGAIFYYHYDAQGSVVFMTNETGQVVQRYEYDAFGNIVLQEGNIPNQFTYKGRQWDVEADMYYFRARHYDPHTGRFAQSDPILSVNPYVFVNNNPVNYGDALGFFAVSVIGTEVKVLGESASFVTTVQCKDGTLVDRFETCSKWVESCPRIFKNDSDGNNIFSQSGGWTGTGNLYTEGASCGRHYSSNGNHCMDRCFPDIHMNLSSMNQGGMSAGEDCLDKCFFGDGGPGGTRGSSGSGSSGGGGGGGYGGRGSGGYGDGNGNGGFGGDDDFDVYRSPWPGAGPYTERFKCHLKCSAASSIIVAFGEVGCLTATAGYGIYACWLGGIPTGFALSYACEKNFCENLPPIGSKGCTLVQGSAGDRNHPCETQPWWVIKK